LLVLECRILSVVGSWLQYDQSLTGKVDVVGARKDEFCEVMMEPEFFGCNLRQDADETGNVARS
jgi:hypothetical protein